MKTIRLTTKRQATFPRELCRDMKIEPGDSLLVDERLVDGERVWILRSATDAHRGWFGALRRYAKGRRHGMAAVRGSIEGARKRGNI